MKPRRSTAANWQDPTVPRKRFALKNLWLFALPAGFLFTIWFIAFGCNNQVNSRTLQGITSIRTENSQRFFQLKVDTTNWRQQGRGSELSTLIPSQGKLMHTFLIRIPGFDAFARIHPERKDSTTFESELPNVPAGKYLVYANILTYSGLVETITDTLVIPGQKAALAQSEAVFWEDTYVVTNPISAPRKAKPGENFVICGLPGVKLAFEDGSYAIMEGKQNEALEAGKAYELNFELFNPDGSACLPEPYLGILGHLAVVRSDGSVFIHLRPAGSFSKTPEQIFKNRLADTTKLVNSPVAFRDTVDSYLARLKAMSVPEREEYLMTEMGMYETNGSGMMGMDHSNRITFPYSFPKAGQYRLFLQVKRNDKVLTGIFDVSVKDSGQTL
ncbi:hypothetical protein [Dyadobacter linearis]|nr:hypothetical protein [Dyadobacter sp. CECT 9623]